jgi:hypothetical protein
MRALELIEREDKKRAPALAGAEAQKKVVSPLGGEADHGGG